VTHHNYSSYVHLSQQRASNRQQAFCSWVHVSSFIKRQVTANGCQSNARGRVYESGRCSSEFGGAHQRPLSRVQPAHVVGTLLQRLPAGNLRRIVDNERRITAGLRHHKDAPFPDPSLVFPSRFVYFLRTLPLGGCSAPKPDANSISRYGDQYGVEVSLVKPFPRAQPQFVFAITIPPHGRDRSDPG